MKIEIPASVQKPESSLACSPGQAWLEEWWNNLSDEERIEARKEAEWYESLTEAERDAFWNQGDEELKQWLDSSTDEDDDDDDLADDDEGELAHSIAGRPARHFPR